MNTLSSYFCKCIDGYTLQNDDRSCIGTISLAPPLLLSHATDFSDVDECLDSALNDCEDKCINIIGSYNCSCDDGFILDIDGRSCNGLQLD